MSQLLNNFVVTILTAVYEATSLKFGSYDLAAITESGNDYILRSSFIHLLEFMLVPICIVLLFAIVRTSRKAHELKRTLAAAIETPPSASPATVMHDRWQEILNHLDSTNESEWKVAVIEADKLVDDILKNSFAGETMGERLMNIDKTQLLSIDSLWEAHKVRNRLAHEVNYFLRHAEAVKAIRYFEAALHELGML
ncbi:MAG TPA: hypothetical protein VG866_01660 [Candidatus Paceibacterota bacterium]|jgi:hypothetical protein|nr:hypothetical protein [Candidatus Paceibacterota bacterium]